MKHSVMWTLCAAGAVLSGSEAAADTVVTVTGPIEASRLGAALVHEHVMCDFVGAAETGTHRYDAEEVVRVMRPYLDALGERGIVAFVDCTPAYIGRDVKVLRRLSELTGIRILTNTGYYGAAGDKFVPRHAYEESAATLAERWIGEWRNGIDGTGIRPGFIKIGVDAGTLSAIDRKLVEAAALAHLQTGLTIACHTGEATAAMEVLEIVKGAGVSLEALIVVHADAISDEASIMKIAQAGAWVELDGVGPQTIQKHLRLVTGLTREGYGNRILVSHDAGWYNVGQPNGGSVRPYTAVSDLLLPALRQVMTERAVHDLLVANPARAFSVAVRKLPTR